MIARTAAWLVLLTALVVIVVGWIGGIEEFTRPLPVGDSMKANTALCFALLALSTLLVVDEKPTPVSRRASVVSAALALAIAGLSFAGYVLDVTLPIDEMIARDPIGTPPGRMAPNTALGLALVAIALLTIRGRRWITLTATLVPLILGFIAFAGYLIGATEFYGFGDFTGMATHTSVSFLLLTNAILLMRPDDEPIRRLLWEDAGGHAARLLVPMFAGVFVLVSWAITATAPDGGGPPLEAVLLANVVLSVGLVGLAWYLAGALHRTEVERREMAEETLREKDRFVASVGHELRTPVAALFGFTELLVSMDDFDLDSDDRREILSTMATQGADLVALLEDLMVAARTDSRSLSVAEVRVSLRAQIAQTVEGLFDNVPEDLNVTGDDVHVTADPLRVRQIMRNLLTNAKRYGGERVIVETAMTDELGIVKVRDNGSGLAEGNEATLFEPYVTFHGEYGRQGSVGLGLRVARNLAIRMGGDIAYEHEDGWTTFALQLPLHREDDTETLTDGVLSEAGVS